jgi:hypothetical protein
VPASRQSHFGTAVGTATHRVLFATLWDIRLVAHLCDSKAWALYRNIQTRHDALIGDREPNRAA